MRGDTNQVHAHIVSIGQALGLLAEREVSLVGDGYRPRLDVLWSLPFTDAQRAATDAVGARVPLVASAIPIGAWEIEGSDASTKGMQANLANMRVFGSFMSFLAVRGGTIDNLHARAIALERTQAHHFGQRRSLVLDCEWIEELARIQLSPAESTLGAKDKAGAGGTGMWAKDVTLKLTSRGTAAGFRVISEYQRRRTDAAPTQSKIDLVWALPLPVGLATLVNEIAKRVGERAIIDAHETALVPVVAFEIENDASKHGHGGLLNLASHAMSGVFVAGASRAAAAAEAAKATYSTVFPLERVTVLREFMR